MLVELTTPRLRLRALQMADSDGMFALWGSEAVCRYSGEVQDYQGNPIEMPAREPAASDKIINFWEQALNDGWGFRWAAVLQDGGHFVGSVGFNSLAETSEIAYHQVPGYWGRGLMREAVAAALEWRWADFSTAFQSEGGAVSLPYCKAIEAFIEDENLASARLVEALGFVSTEEVSDGARRHLLLRSGA